MPQRYQVTLTGQTASAELISILRRTLRQPVAALKQKIVTGSPIIDEQPHHNAYDEFIATITALLRDLDAHSVGYSVAVDGRPETVEYLRNIFARWHKIGRDLQAYDDRIAQARKAHRCAAK